MLRIVIELDRREMDLFSSDQIAKITGDWRTLGNHAVDPMDGETSVYWSPFPAGFQSCRVHILITASMHMIEDLAEDSTRMKSLSALRESLYAYIKNHRDCFGIGQYLVTIRPTIDEVDQGIFVESRR